MLRRLAEGQQLHAADLLRDAKNLAVEKWDSLIPPPLLQINYASQLLDLPGTYEFLRGLLGQAAALRS